MNPTIVNVPQGIVCPACEKPITNTSPVQNREHAQFKKGNIIVCAHCATILQVGDSGLNRMAAEDIEKLDEMSKKVIGVLQQKIRSLVKSGN